MSPYRIPAREAYAAPRRRASPRQAPAGPPPVAEVLAAAFVALAAVWAMASRGLL